MTISRIVFLATPRASRLMNKRFALLCVCIEEIEHTNPDAWIRLQKTMIEATISLVSITHLPAKKRKAHSLPVVPGGLLCWLDMIEALDGFISQEKRLGRNVVQTIEYIDGISLEIVRARADGRAAQRRSSYDSCH